MIEFKLNNILYKLPSSWYEVTFNQYLQFLQIKGDILKTLCVFSGADYEIIKKHKIIGLNKLIACIQFTLKSPEFSMGTPNIGPYKLPINGRKEFDIQFEYLAQFEDMRKIMIEASKSEDKEEAFNDHMKAYPKYCAIYVQPIRDGEYDFLKAMEMVEEIMNYPAHEVISNGAFFFVELTTLLTGLPKMSRQATLTPSRRKQVSKGSKRNSVRMRR